MKKQYRITNTGKGVLNIGTSNLQEIENSNITVTGGTYNSNDGTLVFSNNDNSGFTITGLDANTDTFITGGTYNSNDGTLDFSDNIGGSFIVNGLTFDDTNEFVTGGTVENSTLTLTTNNNNDVVISGFSSGLLQSIDEGNGNGYRMSHINSDNRGNIGERAYDFGFGTVTSTTFGPTGFASIDFGQDNIVSGYGGFSLGDNNQSNETYIFMHGNGHRSNDNGGWNFITGLNNTIGGGANTAMNVVTGANNVGNSAFGLTLGTSNLNQTPAGLVSGIALTSSPTHGSVFMGTANADVSGVTTGFNSENGPSLIIGNGTASSGGPSGVWNALVKSNNLELYRDGRLVLPSTTISGITNDLSGKHVITKEYGDSTYILEGYNETGTNGSGDLDVIIGDIFSSMNIKKSALKITQDNGSLIELRNIDFPININESLNLTTGNNIVTLSSTVDFEAGDTVLFNRSAAAPFVSDVLSVDSPTQITLVNTPTQDYTIISISIVARSGVQADLILRGRNNGEILFTNSGLSLYGVSASGGGTGTINIDESVSIGSSGAIGGVNIQAADNLTLISINGNTDISSNNDLILERNNGGGSGAKITLTASRDSYNLQNIQIYADDVSAGAGGLLTGDIYSTSTGELRIKL